MAYYNPPAIGGTKAQRPEEVTSGWGWVLPVLVAAGLVALLLAWSPIIGGGSGRVGDLLQDACVLVLAPPSSAGSGFIINTEGYIVTNRHVITGGEREPQGGMECIVVRQSGTPRKQSLKARLVDWGHGPIASADEIANDWAILKVDPPQPLPFLRIADSRKARATQPVYAAGYPGGPGNAAVGENPLLTIQEGTIRRMEPGQGGGIVRIDHSATLKDGSSGGPLVDVGGAVLGINNQINAAAGSNFAIPTHRLPDVWRRYAGHPG